jgi:hypothetical protein
MSFDDRFPTNIFAASPVLPRYLNGEMQTIVLGMRVLIEALK